MQFTVEPPEPCLLVDGDIFIRNMPGKGCVFQIELPLAATEQIPL